MTTATTLSKPALPAIASDLKASASAVELTLPSFFAGLAVSQLLFGSLADHLGRRPPLLCGLVLAVIGSIGCALSDGVTELTIWRVVQALGVGSASVIPRRYLAMRSRSSPPLRPRQPHRFLRSP